MKTTQQSLSAIGVAPWLLHDYYQTPPAITLAGYVSSGAVLTWGVQFTADPMSSDDSRDVMLSQAAFVLTVTDLGPSGNGGTHGLSVGDYVKILGTNTAGVDGEYPQVATVVSATQYTLASALNQSFAGGGRAISARVFPHAVLVGQNARAVSNYGFPVRGSRLIISAYVSGVATLRSTQGGMSS